MKRKLVTLGIAFLLCIGMVGAGFASWLITADETVAVNGNITVETVADKRLEMTATPTDGLSVVFGGDTNTPATQGWLKYTGDVAQMDIQFTVNVANYAALVDDNVTFTIAVTAADGTALDLGDYVNLPDTTDKLTWDMLKTDGTENITLSFTWGDAFKPKGGTAGVNPLAYYNAQTYTKSLGDAAETALNALHAFNTKGFKVTVTGKVEISTGA